MKIKLIDFGGEKPRRAYDNDSGTDIFAKENDFIPAGKIKAIPTGIGAEIPDGYDIVVHCKSGLSSKGIFAANAPVDAGYKEEIHAILFNASNEDFEIKKGEKIAQLVVRPVIYADFVWARHDGRGKNGFGSSGK